MSVSSDRARWVISLLIVRMTGDHGILGAFDQMTSGNRWTGAYRPQNIGLLLGSLTIDLLNSIYIPLFLWSLLTLLKPLVHCDKSIILKKDGVNSEILEMNLF